MTHVLFRTVKFTLWGLLLLFVSSHGVPSFADRHSVPKAGTYDLSVQGAETIHLQGSVDFVRESELRKNGQTYSVLKLNLAGKDPEGSHTLGFYIALPEGRRPIGTGTYEFNRDIDGFLAHFEGVFGFASISALGEQPYFTRKGKLTIGHIGRDGLSGSLQVFMENARGESLTVGGDFNSTRRD